MVANQGKRISFYDVGEIFAFAYNRSATIEKTVSGFRACGLWPFNDKIFSNDDFVASALTNEPEVEKVLWLRAKDASLQQDMSCCS